MQKRARKCNLECITHVTLSRKSLLACALLGMLAGNQAMADVSIYGAVLTGDPIVTDGSSIEIDNGFDTTVVDASSILMIDPNNNSVVISPSAGINLTTGGIGESYITSDGSGSSIYGDLKVQGDIGTAGEPVGAVYSGSVNSTTITNTGALTSGTVTAATVNSANINSVNIANSGTISTASLQADSVNATTITGGTITGSLNAAGEKITNVAAGTAGSDAVNYDQLRAVQNSYNSQYDQLASQTNARFNAVDRRIDKVEEVANAGVASVAALAAIPAPAYGKRFSVGAGLGNYSSESAVAVGFRAAITESTSVTAGVSRNTASKTAANLGVGYSW